VRPSIGRLAAKGSQEKQQQTTRKAEATKRSKRRSIVVIQRRLSSTMLFCALRQQASLLSTPLRRSMASLPHKRFSLKKRVKTPTKQLALEMPTSVREMDNSSLITLAAMDDHEASREMLIRHIMRVDHVRYHSAVEKFYEISRFHDRGMEVYLIPYQVGIVCALTGAFASFPLVFHLPTVHWFNEAFVTSDIPGKSPCGAQDFQQYSMCTNFGYIHLCIHVSFTEPKDLETWLEVGSWSWNWMEPPLGQISFFLLCLQYSRYVCSLTRIGCFFLHTEV
jgi:hypothetical protein